MNEYSEELEFSNLKTYGLALKKNLNTPLTVLGETAELLEVLNCRRKYVITVERVNIEREIFQFVDNASKQRWRIEEYKRCLTNEFYRLVRKYFGVYDTPFDCSMCDEHCYVERCCIVLSQELNLYGCLRHASVHECVAKTKTIGNRKFNVQVECPCVGTTVQTDMFCVFSGKIVGKHLLEICSSSKDFSSDDAVTRSKAGFNFRLSKIEFDSVQDIFLNNDAQPKKKHNPRLKRNRSEQDVAPQKTEPTSSPIEENVEFPPEFVVSKEDGFAEDVPDLIENTSAHSSQEIAEDKDTHQAKKRLTANSATVIDQEKRDFLNGNNYFQFKKEGIVQEAERYLRGFAETIMLDLLYDKEARQLLNEEQIFRVSSEMTASLNAYHSAQKRAKMMPNYVSCLSAFLTPQRKLKLLRLVEYDRFQIEMFCGRAVDLWKLCFRSPAYILQKVETCTFKKFVVALLFCMKTGLSIPVRGLAWAETEAVERIQIVKHEPTIEHDLPDENQIRSFGKHGKDNVRKILQTGGVGSTTTTTSTNLQNGDNFSAQNRPRVTHIETIPQRIQVDGVGTIMCKTFLPNYLLDEMIGDTSSYSSSDVSTGMSFFKDCIASFSEENRRLLSFI